MKTILSAVLVFLSIFSFAQTDSVRNEKQDSLWHRNPFFRLYPVVMNNETRLYRGEAQALFSKVPEAFAHYKKYRTRFKVAIYSYAAFFIATIISVEGMDSNERKKLGIGLTVSLASLLNASVFHALSLSSLRKAQKAYNGQSLRF